MAEPNTDQNPLPEPPIEPAGNVVEDAGQKKRSEDIARGAALSQKRFKEEAAVKERIRLGKEERAKKADIGVREADERKRQASLEKKAFRKEEKRRKQEIEEDKRRREEEAKRIEEQQAAGREKRKKQQEYMKDLSVAAEMKFKREKEKLNARLSSEKARGDAQGKAQIRYTAIDHEQYRAKDEAEKALRSRKGVIEAESKKKLYKLEELKRMRLDALDVEIRNRKTAILRKPTRDTSRDENDLVAYLRQQRRLIDNDFDRRREAIAMEERTQKMQADNAHTEEVAKIDATARTKRYDVDRDLGRQLDDIAHGKI